MHTFSRLVDINLDHYEAGACAFGCLDDRFFDVFEEFVEKLKCEEGFEHVDRVIHAGGAKDFAAEGTADQESLFGQLDKSRLLHDPRNRLIVLATTHEDCGACGEEAKCDGDRRKQFLYHLALHRDIDEAILKHSPELAGRIRHFYLSIHGVIELDLAHHELDEEDANALALVA